MPIDPKIIDDLKAKHGEIHEIEAAGETIAIKVADRGSWKRFRAMRADEKKRLDAPEQLLRDVVVHPSPAEFDALLDRRPGLGETFAMRAQEICGLTDDVTTRKH